MRDRRIRSLALVAAACSIVALGAVPAAAGAPDNDAESAAVKITDLPFSSEQDTTEATNSGPRLCRNSNRGSVFFSFRSPNDVRIQIDTIGSDYDTLLAVYRRTRSGVDPVRCDEDAFYPASGVRFLAQAGVRYVVMVAQERRVGGQLTLSATTLSDTDLEMTADVTASTYDPAGGNATITGTVSCTERSWFYLRRAELRQVREGGVFVAGGYSYDFGTCTPEDGGAWELEFETETGVAFGEGDARFSYEVSANDGFGDRVLIDEQVLTVALVAD